jgi:hypothetical protein
MKIELPVETLKYRYRLKNGRETVTTKDSRGLRETITQVLRTIQTVLQGNVSSEPGYGSDKL